MLGLNFHCQLETLNVHRLNYREMISFNIDPQLCGLLFSIYCRNEKGPPFSASCFPYQDAFATCSVSGPFLDSDWGTFAGNVGFEICRISSTWAVIFETVKASGVILLLGFGSFICYKLYHCYLNYYDHRKHPSPKVSKFKNHAKPNQMTDSFLEDFEDSDTSSIEGQYFGPTSTSHEVEYNDLQERAYSAKTEGYCSKYFSSNLNKQGNSSREFVKNNNSINENHKVFNNPSKILQSFYHRKKRESDRNHHAIKSENHSRPVGKHEIIPVESQINNHNLVRDTSFDSTCSDISLDLSFRDFWTCNNSKDLEKLQEEIDDLKTSCLKMDEEFENIKCNRNLPGMSSLLSAKLTDTKTDADFHIESDSNAILKQQKANECFTDLYSLTTINSTTSSDLSDSAAADYSTINNTDFSNFMNEISRKPTVRSLNAKKISRNNTNDIVSVAENDNLFFFEKSANSSPIIKQKNIFLKDSLSGEKLKMDNIELPRTCSENELMDNMEWDENDISKFTENCDNDIDDGIWFGTNLNICDSKKETNFEQVINKNEHNGSILFSDNYVNEENQNNGNTKAWNLHTPSTENMATMMTSVESGYADSDEINGDSSKMLTDNHQKHYKKVQCFASNKYFEESAMLNTEQLFQLPLSQVESILPLTFSVGKKVDLFHYGVQEWYGKTKEAENTLKGCSEIPSLLGYRRIRQMKHDGSSCIRAVIFQVLSQGCYIPSGKHTLEILSEDFRRNNSSWLQRWKFDNNVLYHNKDILKNVQLCLQSLDNMVLLLSTCEQREEILTATLNSDPSLDSHVIEAVKFHMLRKIMEIQTHSTNDNEVLHSIKKIIGRNISLDSKDCIKNHLFNMGIARTINEVQLNLLGYSLGVLLQVVQPSAYGSDGYIYCYPEWNKEVHQPKIFLITDGTYYNVLMK